MMSAPTTAPVSVKAMFLRSFIDTERMNAWLETLPPMPLDGKCVTPDCDGDAEDGWYVVQDGAMAWEGVTYGEPEGDDGDIPGPVVFYGRGWDAYGDDGGGCELSFVLCERCMSAYALPEDDHWS